MSVTQVSQFEAILGRLTPNERAFIEATADRAAEAAIRAAAHRHYERPADRVTRVIGERVSPDVRRGLIASWALGLPARVEAEALPDVVLELYPFWLDHLATWLGQQTGPYDRDYWAKDVRFTLCLSVPGNRTQTLDLLACCRPGQIARDALRRRDPRVLIRYMALGGWHRNWLQTHTESRHTDDFNEEGWDRLWACAAALCRSRPDVAGVFGSSWFFDPPLESISPRLAYLRNNPMAGGAFLVDQGPGRTHSDRASATSPTRRALIQAGDYVPHSWLMAWPRKPLIAWLDGKARLVLRYERRRQRMLDRRQAWPIDRRAVPRAGDRREHSRRKPG